MKRYWIHVLAALVTFGFGVSVAWITSSLFGFRQTKVVVSPADSRCTHEKIQLIQPASGVRLRILEASCSKFSSRVVLAVENIGAIGIKRFDIVMDHDYKHKKGVRSRQAVNSAAGLALNIGETQTLTLGDGYKEEVSCRKRSGMLRRTVIWVRHLDFADGSSADYSGPSAITL